MISFEGQFYFSRSSTQGLQVWVLHYFVLSLTPVVHISHDVIPVHGTWGLCALGEVKHQDQACEVGGWVLQESTEEWTLPPQPIKVKNIN